MQMGVKALQSVEEVNDFVSIMADKDRMGLNVHQIASKFNISPETMYVRARDPAINKMIKELRAAKWVSKMPQVDDYLERNMKKGDTKAIALAYERWDDYDPKHNSSNTLVQINITQENGDE